jgi:hypothetical protein
MPKQEKQTPEEIEAENQLLQQQVLKVQLETAQIALEQQKEQNEQWKARREATSRNNKRRQAQLARDRKVMTATQRACRHRQGGRHENIKRGTGASSLTRSEIFFQGNFLIQCNRCGLKMQRPHPLLRKIDRKLYDKAMEEYNYLLAQSEENELEPMHSTTFTFTRDDGTPIIPRDPGAVSDEDIPRPELLNLRIPAEV